MRLRRSERKSIMLHPPIGDGLDAHRSPDCASALPLFDHGRSGGAYAFTSGWGSDSGLEVSFSVGGKGPTETISEKLRDRKG